MWIAVGSIAMVAASVLCASICSRVRRGFQTGEYHEAGSAEIAASMALRGIAKLPVIGEVFEPLVSVVEMLEIMAGDSAVAGYNAHSIARWAQSIQVPLQNIADHFDQKYGKIGADSSQLRQPLAEMGARDAFRNELAHLRKVTAELREAMEKFEKKRGGALGKFIGSKDFKEDCERLQQAFNHSIQRLDMHVNQELIDQNNQILRRVQLVVQLDRKIDVLDAKTDTLLEMSSHHASTLSALANQQKERDHLSRAKRRRKHSLLEHEIARSELEIDRTKMIAKGSAGQVFAAKYNGVDCAVKHIPLQGTAAQRQHIVDGFKKELVVQINMCDPYVVQVFGCCTEYSDHLMLVMELMPLGSLRDLLIWMKRDGQHVGQGIWFRWASVCGAGSLFQPPSRPPSFTSTCMYVPPHVSRPHDQVLPAFGRGTRHDIPRQAQRHAPRSQARQRSPRTGQQGSPRQGASVHACALSISLRIQPVAERPHQSSRYRISAWPARKPPRCQRGTCAPCKAAKARSVQCSTSGSCAF